MNRVPARGLVPQLRRDQYATMDGAQGIMGAMSGSSIPYSVGTDVGTGSGRGVSGSIRTGFTPYSAGAYRRSSAAKASDSGTGNSQATGDGTGDGSSLNTSGGQRSTTGVDSVVLEQQGIQGLSSGLLDFVGGRTNAFPGSGFADSFSPSSLNATLPEDKGIFGGDIGPKIRNSVFGKIILGALKINPGTQGLMMGIDLIRGLQNTSDPKQFLQDGLKQMAFSKVLGQLGLTQNQKMLGLTGIDIARGDQTVSQGFQNLASSAVYQKMAPSIYKRAYKEGGMPAVYLAASVLQQGMKGVKGKIMSGPPGDG